MKGTFIVNRYYRDEGMEYIYSRLKEEFANYSVALDMSICPISSSCGVEIEACDFVIFWDKDVTACKMLENKGIRVYNNSYTLEVCDSKISTYLALYGEECLIPTIFSPKRYDVNDERDEGLLDRVLGLGFPVIVKEDVGSQGRQGYLASDLTELKRIQEKLLHAPHTYQKFVGDKRGEDIRFYLAGGKFACACTRTNTTSFASNVCMGGKVELYQPKECEIALAQKIAGKLKMDFGSVDFIREKDNLYFVEANSNAYFKGIESKGVNVARSYVEYIVRDMKC